VVIDVTRLDSIPLFAGLSEEQRAAVASLAEERTVDAGTHLSREEGSGYFFFAICEGNADVERDGKTVAQLGPGDFFGELAILKTRRRTATVTATSPMTLAVIFGADFAKLTAEIPALTARVDEAIAARMPEPRA
jgi:CRP/FNR family cyclic AMP-dependent transcriptional regulator